ncbi:MAG: response regulator [Bacteroidales bacterium]
MVKVNFISLIRRFALPISIYFIGVVVFLTIIYQEKKYAYLKSIDQQLAGAIQTIPFILNKDFHDRATDSLAISPEEDWSNINKLTIQAKQLNVSFLYTLIIRNGKAYFTSCSTNNFELQHKTSVRYFTEYNEASSNLKQLLITNKILYETTTDRWGTFRSALKPYYSPKGNIYIAGADVDINNIEQKLNTELMYLILSGLILTLLFIPTVIQIIRIDKRIADLLKRKIEERTAELSKELINHKQTIIKLQKTIKEKEEFAIKAKEALDSKVNLISTISYELRTPLNVIIGINTLLSQTELNQEQKDYCSTINNAAQQIIKLIEEAMQVYYSQPERINLEFSVFEISDLLMQLINQYSQVLRHKKLTLEYNIDERIPKHLIGDVSFIRQIIFNLINNSIKFSENGKITIDVVFEEIETQENKVIVLFKIIDNGIGVDEEQQKKILKALNDDSIFNKSSELGLGLTLCKHLSKMLGASIWFKSEKGKGTVFYFRIPLAVGTGTKNPHDLPLIPEDANSKVFNKDCFHILLAEDNELNVKVALRSLEKYKHEISVAKNGNEVITLLKNNHFDIILMDIEMPEMDGIETATFIRNHPEEVGHINIPIIALTAHATPDMQNKCKQVGIHHFVVKPINFNDLNNLMHQLINNTSNETNK